MTYAMPVVSNTSPILNLAIIGKLELLRHQFEHVVIPQAVLDELRVGEDLPGSGTIGNALSLGWITTHTVDNISLAKVLQRNWIKENLKRLPLLCKLMLQKFCWTKRKVDQWPNHLNSMLQAYWVFYARRKSRELKYPCVKP